MSEDDPYEVGNTDTARLDWLIDMGYVSDLRHFSDGQWGLWFAYGKNARAAIDRAMGLSADPTPRDA